MLIELRKHVVRHSQGYITAIGWIVLMVLATYLLYKRYPYSFTQPNFYAEDGKDYVAHLYIHGLMSSLFSFFNGYLILIQYALAALAMGLNEVVGNGFVTLPKAIAVVSYMFMASVVTFPWLLFRRVIGNVWSIVLVIISVYVPLGGWDYLVIGTIGNTKFLVFYAAFLFIMYRINTTLVPLKSKRLFAIDLALLTLILTNVTVIGLLPIALLRYKAQISDLFTSKYRRIVQSEKALWSFLALCVFSIIYVGVIYIRGIPAIPGYLDEPLHIQGLINTLFRGSWYGILYPLYGSVNIVFVSGILISSFGILLSKKYRMMGLLCIYAVTIAVLGFVLNRPGVTHYFDAYALDGGPGQFFYGGTLIFIFAVFYFLSDSVKKLSIKGYIVLGVVLFLYGAIAFPQAGYGSKSYATYANRPTIYNAVPEACRHSGNEVVVQIYPTKVWDMRLPRDIVCR